MTDIRSRVQRAMEKHHAKLAGRKPRTKPNGRPEKEVERDCMEWLKEHGFSCHVVESKAVYSHKAGRYIKGQTDEGFADCVGVYGATGTAVFIEFKAPGRVSTLRPAQKHFLRTKIDHNAFAVVIDSVEKLEQIWNEYLVKRASLSHQSFLFSQLP